MNRQKCDELFSDEVLARLFPKDRADQFFDALLGDASEGAYDISLGYAGTSGDTIQFEIILTQRPGHCLACNLTHGLPQVFSRHPVINLKGLAQNIEELLGNGCRCVDWAVGSTNQKTRTVHVIPFSVRIEG